MLVLECGHSLKYSIQQTSAVEGHNTIGLVHSTGTWLVGKGRGSQYCATSSACL